MADAPGPYKGNPLDHMLLTAITIAKNRTTKPTFHSFVSFALPCHFHWTTLFHLVHPKMYYSHRDMHLSVCAMLCAIAFWNFNLFICCCLNPFASLHSGIDFVVWHRTYIHTHIVTFSGHVLSPETGSLTIHLGNCFWMRNWVWRAQMRHSLTNTHTHTHSYICCVCFVLLYQNFRRYCNSNGCHGIDVALLKSMNVRRRTWNELRYTNNGVCNFNATIRISNTLNASILVRNATNRTSGVLNKYNAFVYRADWLRASKRLPHTSKQTDYYYSTLQLYNVLAVEQPKRPMLTNALAIIACV